MDHIWVIPRSRFRRHVAAHLGLHVADLHGQLPMQAGLDVKLYTSCWSTAADVLYSIGYQFPTTHLPSHKGLPGQ